jgi:uncharacterized protein (TIGR00156 family)
MKSTVFVHRMVAVMLAAGSIAFAGQASAAGDQAPADLGPRAVVKMTTKQVTDHGRNEQVVRLRGRIVSHEGGENYTFGDDAGTLPLAITRAQLPGRHTLKADQRVEVVGQIHKMARNQLELKVRQVKLIQ